MRASATLVRWSLLLPFALFVAIALVARSPWWLLPLALLPMAMRIRRDFDAAPPGHAFTPILFRTVMLEVEVGVLLAIGAIGARVWPAQIWPIGGS